MKLGHVVRVFVVVALATTGVVNPLRGGSNVAHAAAAVTIGHDIDDQTLIGGTTSVTAHIGNAGDTTAFNLMLVLRLPLGVHLATSELPPANTIVETDAAGDPTGTVVSFENIVDIIPGGAYNFGYSLSHDVGTDPDEWEVFDTIDTTMEAYASDAEADVPNTEPQTAGSQTTAVITDSASSASDDAGTELVPILLTKSEPSPESELLRGLHDHQTVYTITAETGAAAGVQTGIADDYIPAGIEFLGCGTDDNSSAEEYPGSGPINPGNAPSLPAGACLDPILVETVQDPPGLPGGVYTHVQWDLGNTLPINSVIERSYIAAIPMYENTMTWPSGEPDPASGLQGSNIDNNTGPLTTQLGEGTSYTNYISVETTFPGSSGSVDATETVEAVDLVVHKYVDRQEINQDEISTWTLQLQTSEYVVDGGVSGLSLADVAPDGACPIGSANTGCTGTTEPAAAPAYSSTDFPATGPRGGPGTTQLDWDLSATTLGPNEEFYVTFSTLALANYANGTPIVTNDQWTNHVDMAANVTTFEAEGPDGTHEPGRDVIDASNASQAGASVSMEKEVARPPDGQSCGNGAGLDWQPESVDATGPGDRVCFRITTTPPDYLDTIDATLSDFLPIGFDYEAGSSVPGPANQVPPDIINDAVAFGTPESGVRVDWTLESSSFIEPAQVAQVVFGAILVDSMPDLADSGDSLVNRSRYSYQNTSGEIFVDSDDADVIYSEALLDLTKSINDVNGTPQSPTIDTAIDVSGGQTVTYEIVVTNSGTADATAVEVLDTLPINNDGITADDGVCAAVSTISSGGTCASNDITWSGLTVPANDSITLEYTWTVPAAASASTSWDNEAGVVEYHTSTNMGPDFEYVPRDNIDPSREPAANTSPADDDAHVFSPGISVTKSRTTSVAEPGNARAGQATIGEVISYTIEYRQSAGTTADDPALVDTLPATLDLDESSVVLNSYDTSPGAPCVSGTPITPADFTAVDNVITVAAVGEVVAPTNADRCAVLTFDATVLDVAGPVRSNRVRNTAIVTFLVGGQPRTVSASVNTSVVEPNLSIDKRSSSPGSVLPGTPVPYEIVVTNTSAAQVSPAHDLVVTDALPAEVDSVDPNTISPAGGVYDAGAGMIAWTLDPSFDLDPGESLTLSYTTTLASPLDAGSTFANTATVTGTSLAGVVAGERTAVSTCSTAGCPGYEASDSLTLTVAGPTITKRVVDPSQTFGHTVDYVLTATFPANLNFGPTTITDNLAGGDLKFLSTVNAICVGCTDADRAQYVPPPDGLSTTPPVWDLGDIGPGPATRRVIITSRAVVVNNTGLASGNTVTNTATLDWGTGGGRDDQAVISLAEPELTLTKSAASSTEPALRDDTSSTDAVAALPDDTLIYELEITNIGDWTAYDTVVTDEPDSVSSGGSCTGDSRLTAPNVASDPSWQVVDDTLGTGDACLEWLIPSILPGQSVTLTYTVVVPPDFPRADLIVGPEIVNVASVPEYWALTDAERAVSPADVRPYPDAPVTDDGYVNLNGAILGDFVWFDIDADGVQDPGEPGIAGVSVTATGPAGTVDSVTDASGNWLTTDDSTTPPTWLIEGDYTISIDTATLPAGTSTNTGDPDGTTDSTTTTTLDENEDDRSQDFGYTGNGSIGDLVWIDFDDNGTGPDNPASAGDPSEVGLAGVTVTATWAGPTADPGDDVTYPAVTTGSDGRYLIRNLPPGDYTVTVDDATLPDGVDPTYDLNGIGTANVATRTLVADENATNVDFGYAGTGSIGDMVWGDGGGGVGGIGVYDPLVDVPLAGVSVTATWAGRDGDIMTADDNVAFPAAVTADTDNANYIIGNLPFGTYSVAVTGLAATAAPSYDLDGIGTPNVAVSEVTSTEPTNLELDFGYTAGGSLGDRLWVDLNSNGVQDGGEPGIPDVLMQARWAGFDGVFEDSGGDDVYFVAGTATDADGLYTISNLPAGDYRVSVWAGLPEGLTTTYVLDPYSSVPPVAQRTLGVTGDDVEDATDVDFGFVGTGSIGDTIWLDLNGDGARDGGEPGIPDISVTVVWAGFDDTFGNADDIVYDGTTGATLTTSAAGTYAVSELLLGDYRVTLDTGDADSPAGLTPSYDLDDNSTVATGTADSAEVELTTDAPNRLDVDFGYTGTGSIGDFVWYDIDGDTVQDVADPDFPEPGIPGVDMTVVWAGLDGVLGTGDDITYDSADYPTLTTDANGGYTLSNLPAGDYRVTVDFFDLAPAMQPTFDLDGTGTGNIADRTLTAAEDATDVDFGYTGTATVGDHVWLDLNADGGRDAATEPGIEGVELTLVWAGFDGVLDTADDIEIATLTTDAGGVYDFTNVPGRRVRVTIDETTLPVGLTPTHDLDGIDTPDTTARGNIDLGTDANNVDFGYAGTAAVGDTVWLDRNLDGDHDPLIEPGIPNRTVTATWGGFDGTVGAGGDDIVLATTATNADGEYLFEHLPPGEVQIVVDDAALPAAGLDRTFDPDGTLDATTIRTLAAGDTDLDADFGYNGANTIGDLVWYDIDNDGIGPDSATPDSEPGIPGQPVNVRWVGIDGTFDTADDLIYLPVTTDADGRWSVDGLPNGNVRVTLAGGPADDLAVTYDRDGSNDLTTEFDITGDDDDFDFGLTGIALIGDRVWLDYDADRVQDAIEPGLAGVDVKVRWAGWNGAFNLLPGPGNDDVVYEVQTTNATGMYEIGDLPPGRYRVTVDDATLPDGIDPTFDLDGVATANVAERSLTVGQVGRNVDFGYAGTAELGNFVWWDLDGDMIQDAAEPGIPGASVIAVWSGVDGMLGSLDDKVLPPTTTDAAGAYEFMNLPAGDFRISVIEATLPSGLSETFDLDGGGDSTAVRAITTGDTANNVDFGYVGALSVGDLVWDDVDLDTVRRAGEPAVAGAEIVLRYLGPDGAPDGGDDVFFEAITANPPQVVPSGRLTEAADPNAGDPFYEFTGLVPGNYVATLDPATLPSGFEPVSDLDGGDPVTTNVTLTGDNLDVDFVVFQNVAPVPPAPVAEVACGSDVEVDPLAGVTDANGDTLTLVPGSVVAPAGVTVQELSNGDLRIMTTSEVADGSQVRWTVQDEHGATTTVTLTLDVNCIDASASVVCSTTGAQSMTYFVTGVGRPATPPVTITWYGSDGAQLYSANDQALSGQIAWPASVPRDGVTVGFATADGAVTDQVDPSGGGCQVLPPTGANSHAPVGWAMALLVVGVGLVLSTRRRTG